MVSTWHNKTWVNAQKAESWRKLSTVQSIPRWTLKALMLNNERRKTRLPTEEKLNDSLCCLSASLICSECRLLGRDELKMRVKTTQLRGSRGERMRSSIFFYSSCFSLQDFCCRKSIPCRLDSTLGASVASFVWDVHFSQSLSCITLKKRVYLGQIRQDVYGHGRLNPCQHTSTSKQQLSLSFF